MEDAKIVLLTHKHIAQVEKWPSQYAAANTLLKTPMETGGQRPNSYGWAVVRGEEVLAIATVKLNKEHVGYLNCIVKPANKHKGIGTFLVEYVLRQPVIDGLAHLHAVVDTGNTSARQILKEQGFTLIGNNEEGYLEYAKHKHY